MAAQDRKFAQLDSNLLQLQKRNSALEMDFQKSMKISEQLLSRLDKLESDMNRSDSSHEKKIQNKKVELIKSPAEEIQNLKHMFLEILTNCENFEFRVSLLELRSKDDSESLKSLKDENKDIESKISKSKKHLTSLEEAIQNSNVRGNKTSKHFESEIQNHHYAKKDQSAATKDLDARVKKIENQLEVFTEDCKKEEGQQFDHSGKKISNLLKDNKSSNAALFDWIDNNCQDMLTNPIFIRKLTTEILESSIERQGTQWMLNEISLRLRIPVLKNYFNMNPLFEDQALISIQFLMHRLKHPNRLMHQLLEMLYDDDVLTERAFLEWEKNKNPLQQEGKEMALRSCTQFFSWLKEAEEEDVGEFV